MCLGFEITCSKYPHSSARHKKSNGSFHICFPSLVIPGEALFVRHITVLLRCNCLCFAKGHSSFISLPTHMHIRGGETNMLSCCFPALPFFRDDLVLVWICSLCARSNVPVSLGEGWHQLASDGSNSNHGSFSVGAPVQQSRLLGEVAIPSFPLFHLPFLIFFNSIL